MARGNGVIVSGKPEGRIESVRLSTAGAVYPGIVVTVKPGTTVGDDGLFTYEPAGLSSGQMGADGDRIGVAVLLEDWETGKTLSDTYADEALAKVYWPLEGDQLNMYFQNQSGTGDDVVAGTTKLIIDDGTGKVLPTTGSPEQEPFLGLENVTDPTADQHVWCQFLGN